MMVPMDEETNNCLELIQEHLKVINSNLSTLSFVSIELLNLADPDRRHNGFWLEVGLVVLGELIYRELRAIARDAQLLRANKTPHQ